MYSPSTLCDDIYANELIDISMRYLNSNVHNNILCDTKSMYGHGGSCL